MYDAQRTTFREIAAAAIESGDDASVVAKVIVEAATASRPRLRYTAGPVARQVSLLRRFAPRPVFDRQIRKLNQLPAVTRGASTTASVPSAAGRR